MVFQATTTQTALIATVAVLAATGCDSCANRADGETTITPLKASSPQTTTTAVTGPSAAKRNRYLITGPPVVTDPHHPGGHTTDGSGTGLHYGWSFTYEDARKAGDLAELCPEKELFQCCRLLGGRGGVSVRVHFNVRHGIARKRRLVAMSPEATDEARHSQTIECIEQVYARREVPASALPTEFTLDLTCATPKAR